MKFCTDIQGPQRKNPTDSGDPLTIRKDCFDSGTETYQTGTSLQKSLITPEPIAGAIGGYKSTTTQ